MAVYSYQTEETRILKLSSPDYSGVVSYSYTIFSSVLVSGEDYGQIGFISGSPQISEYANTPISDLANEVVSIFGTSLSVDDYGFVSQQLQNPSYAFNYGLITTVSATPFGLFNLDGSALIKPSLGFIGSGTLSKFSSSTISKSSLEEVSSTFNVGGSAESSFTPTFVSSRGSLLVFDSLEERAAYSYNESSIDQIFSYDYGFIGDEVVSYDPDQAEDYGYLAKNVGDLIDYRLDTDDYGEILPDVPNYPYGSFGIGGESTTGFSLRTIGSGSLFGLSGASVTFIEPVSSSDNPIRIFGESQNSFSYANYQGSGILFGFDKLEERRTYSYNTSAVISIEGEDYGLITSLSLSPQISEYANTPISDLADEVVSTFGTDLAADDYGLVSQPISDPSYAFNYGLISTVDARPYGLFNIEGISETGFSLRQSGIGRISTLGGSANSVAITRSQSAEILVRGSADVNFSVGAYSGSGSILTNIDKVERASYAYNESAVIDLLSEDFGLLEPDVPNEIEDYGYLENVDDGLPPVFEQEDYQDLSPDVDITPYGSFNIFGQGFVTGVKFHYFGSGSLGNFGSSTTGFSIKAHEEPEGIFRVGGSATSQFSKKYPYIGFGRIISFGFKSAITSFNQRFELSGTELFKVAGKVETRFNLGYNGTGSLFAFSGTTKSQSNVITSTGLFSIGGSSQEAYTFRSLEKPQIIAIRGSADSAISNEFTYKSSETTSFFITGSSVDESISSRTYIGSGGIGIIVGGDLRKTYEYDGDGRISTIGGSAELKTNAETSRVLFSFEGSALTQKVSSSAYSGSGSILAFSEKSESITSFEIGERATFNIRGSAITSARSTISVFGGSGTLAVKGDAVTSYRSTIYVFESSGSVSVEGSANYNLGRVYDSSIEISIESEYGEAFTPATYVGSGSVFSFISSSEASSKAEDKGHLFSFSGSASVQVSILQQYRPTGLFDIRSSSTEAFVPATYVGSGNISTLLSSTTAYLRTFTPEETTTLFEFNGSGTIRKSNVYVGTGNITPIIGTSYITFYDYETSAKTLFKLISITTEAYSRAPFSGSGETYFVGSSGDRKVDYEPPRSTRIFVI